MTVMGSIWWRVAAPALLALAVLATPSNAAADPACDTLNLGAVHSGESVSGSLACADPSGTGLNYSIAAEPDWGSAIVEGFGEVFYYSNFGHVGHDSFEVEVDDNEGGSTTVTVQVEVVNNAPACNALSASTAAGSPVTVQLVCSDFDGDPITLEKATDPLHGTVGAIDPPTGHITYTPAAGFHGTDSFTYRAGDTMANSAPATVTIEVENRAPTCEAVSASTAAGSPVTVQLSCTDPDGDPLALDKVTDPLHGTLGAIDQGTGTVTYTPSAGYAGTDYFAYRASDGGAESPAASVSLTVNPPTAPPGPGGVLAGGGGGAGGGPAGGGGGGGARSLDLAAPIAALLPAAKQRLGTVLARGFLVRASCNEPCRLKLELSVTAQVARKLKLGKKATVVGGLSASAGTTAKSLRIRLGARAKRALKGARSVALRLGGVATDAVGNRAAPVIRPVTLRR